MRTFESVAELAAAAGETIGQSDWVTITQEDVNLFADATGDHQWIHVDPERAKAGPFGTTIAHGFMTLSLLPATDRPGAERAAERLREAVDGTPISLGAAHWVGDTAFDLLARAQPR